MPLAAVVVVVILVPLPAAGRPFIATTFPHLPAVNPHIVAVPPFVVPALPGVAPANDDVFLARRRRRVRSTVDDDLGRLRRLCSDRAEAERREGKPAQGGLPV